MTTHILGISAYYHDSAACLVRDGEIIAAAQEERFTRKKHDAAFPRRRLATAFARGASGSTDLGYVGFYDKPLLKFERILETYLGDRAPRASARSSRRCRSGSRRSSSSTAQLARRAAAYDGSTSLYCRAPRVARGQRVLPVAVRRGRRADAWTASASGRPPSIGVGEGNEIEIARASCAFPTRSACSTRRSPTTPASRSTRASTRSWGWRPTASRSTWSRSYDKLLDLRDDGSFRLNMDYFNY